jgi:hypothetical protein
MLQACKQPFAQGLCPAAGNGGEQGQEAVRAYHQQFAGTT